jgi:hypothetical protein
MNLPLGLKLKDMSILPDETRPCHVYCARTDETFHVDIDTYNEVAEYVKPTDDINFSEIDVTNSENETAEQNEADAKAKAEKKKDAGE